jgi:RNA polymerase sigma factor (sigma-70 family)
MPRNSDFLPDRIDDLLAWLSPDRELATSLYLELRHSLLRIFAWNQCADPEGLTDETFDRVLRQVHILRDTFEGNPKLFFYGVANNLIKEYRKRVKSHVPIEEIELVEDPPQELEEETSEQRKKCLRKCLRKLPKDKRDQILNYYSQEKQAKIIHRAKMARQLGLSIEALRVRMLRIRVSLEACIELCLDEPGEK